MTARWGLACTLVAARVAHADPAAPTCAELRAARLRAAHEVPGATARAEALRAVPACPPAPEPPPPPPLAERPIILAPTPRPPLSGARVGGELFVGSVAGVLVGGLGGGYLGAAIEMGQGCRGDACGLGGFLLGGYLGLTLMSSVGVHVVGTSGDQTGSFGAALGGSVLGGLAGVLAMGVLSSPDDDDSAIVAVPLLLLGPTVGATIGFNRSRRYRPDARVPVSLLPTLDVTPDRQVVGVAGRF